MGQIVSSIFQTADLTYSWMLLTPLIGGVLAGLLFKYLYEPMWIIYKQETRVKTN